MIEATMKAARVHARGPAEFRTDNVPTPQPGPGQLLVRVESAGVNFSDVKRRRGDPYPFETAFPFTPGGEVAGTVAAHGPGVDGPPVGTRVLALAGPDGFGGYAQYAVAYATTAMPLPLALSYDVASVVLVAGSTAKVMLEQAARLQPGESVLVPAATGGVGSFLLQVARQMKAGRIIAAVGDLAKRDRALALGADEVVDYSASDWPSRVRELKGGSGVDVGLEASGGGTLTETLSCLAPFGRLVVFGAASGISASLDAGAIDRLLYNPAANQSITGFNIGDWFMARPAVAGAALHALVHDLVAGRLRAPEIRTLPLADARLAHELIEGRRSSGKLVIKPWL